MRMTGFATGMDINQMVKDLMQAERMPVQRMEQDKIEMERKMDEFREVNRKLDQFRQNTFDGIYRRSNMLQREASSTNESLVTASAQSSSQTGSFTIDEVTRLASAATAASETAIVDADGAKADQNASLADLFGEEEGLRRGTLTAEEHQASSGDNAVRLNTALPTADGTLDTDAAALRVVVDGQAVQFGEDFTLSEDGTELLFHEAFSSTASVEITSAVTDETGGDTFFVSDLTAAHETGAVTDTFIFSGEETIADAVDALNRSETGVNVFFDEQSSRISVQRDETGRFNGEDGEPELTFDTGIGGAGLFGSAFHLTDSGASGSNAAFTVNGLETYRTSNEFTINDVTMTLHETFDAGSVTVGTTVNTDGVFETIMDFVAEYNEIVEHVNDKLGEDYYRDYAPLTDDQRADMTEREIDLWEERSESGLLRGDRTLRNGMTSMRTDFYTPIAAENAEGFTHLAQIGIATTNDYTQGGKLEVDEEALKAAIDEDSEAIFHLFTADGDNYGEKGIARRLRDSADQMIESISIQAGGMRGRNMNHQFTLGRGIERMDNRISNFERRMEQVEDRYWSQFNAMEAAVNRANQQADTLFSFIY
ncbi:flagellar filament capping protein FliD [Salisediminibacterium halotolerans]|uniref:flagellar filament capping protein FliD n=1 Tax=Salisediminibacterium halotolerans TaxID=517425 RepID=UPI000EB22912|nr:flagellar filament capping protein FliD [Salisediminibacterium halotolerans]RLJ75494.1 flagellar hook-associated protein 2 [Actinophytocola xinjiangensis]RPE89347.1 flagellar hook-associated protein 2 [Salisediminibacterium halotolerans]TWG36107.1 flagellar hook-associated protein 2 [Salisediminibacterium halotolerans]GEL08031.1 hypothetical protein SHA02_14470 [Salisediminibacterium halotolerans]